MSANNLNNKINNIINNNNEANINFTNVDLIKFGIHNNILLIDSMKKTWRKYAIKDYTNTCKINIIILIVKKLKAKNTNYIKIFLYIHHYQIAKYNYLDKNNIKNIKKNIVVLWQKIIYQSS